MGKREQWNDESLKEMRFILDYWTDGGLLLLPIAAVALAIWMYLFRLQNMLRVGLSEGRATESVLDAWLSGQASRADTLRRLDKSAHQLAHIVANTLRTASSGKAAREQCEEIIRRHEQHTQRDVFVLKALTAAAPLLGLLGTVTGMVTTFAAVSGQGTDSARLVAGGISAALITTQYGLMASLPGVFGLLHLNHLRTRRNRVLGTVGILLYIAFTTKEPLHA